MGAVSPVPFADAAFMQKVEERIIKPTIKGLQQDAISYFRVSCLLAYERGRRPLRD
jgi:phosphoribosylamine-glycine ligase